MSPCKILQRELQAWECFTLSFDFLAGGQGKESMERWISAEPQGGVNHQDIRAKNIHLGAAKMAKCGAVLNFGSTLVWKLQKILCYFQPRQPAFCWSREIEVFRSCWVFKWSNFDNFLNFPRNSIADNPGEFKISSWQFWDIGWANTLAQTVLRICFSFEAQSIVHLF